MILVTYRIITVASLVYRMYVSVCVDQMAPWVLSWADSVVYYGYDWALNNNHQATAYINWETDGDLVVSIAWPSNDPVEYLRTDAFQGIDTTNFEFGMAGRVGGATWDVLIDDMNIEYSYSVPVPGLGGIAVLAGIGAVRRRRR